MYCCKRSFSTLSSNKVFNLPRRGPVFVLKAKRTKISYENSHRHISTGEWFDNRKKAPAGVFSGDKMRVPDNLEEYLFGGGRGSHRHVSEGGIRFTAQPRVEV